MKSLLLSWQLWAVLSAVFAALTAIFAKIGVENVNADLATFIRTIVVVVVLAAILMATGEWQPPTSISGRTYLFLLLSGLGTGASWLCYFRALQLGPANMNGFHVFAIGAICGLIRLAALCYEMPFGLNRIANRSIAKP